MRGYSVRRKRGSSGDEARKPRSRRKSMFRRTMRIFALILDIGIMCGLAGLVWLLFR